MHNLSSKRPGWPTFAIVIALALIVTACGAAATPTAVPATPTSAAAAPAATATKAAAAPTTAPTKAAAAPTTAPAASSASFSKAILPLLQKNCTRCHGGSSPRAGLSLDSYTNVLKGSGRPAVVPGNPDSSPMYTLVKSGAMPYGGPKLADANVQLIFDWIKAGAANN